MRGLRDQFQHFYPPDKDDIAKAMKTGLVTPDTNVLLALYRFQAGARDELLGALEKLGDRLWISHQVALEFHRNRLNVIAEQQTYFRDTRRELEQSIAALKKTVMAFGSRIALGRDRIENIDDRIEMLFTDLLEEVTTAEANNEVRLKDHDSDKILARIEALFDGRVGEAMESSELDAAKKEARRRVDAKIPPGYKDRDKPDPTGDYLVWRQLMTEANERKLPVVLITDDRKEDWYRREHGLTLGARHELREEMMAATGVCLLIMSTETFLQHAETYLNAEVSPETVDQAKELIKSASKLDILVQTSWRVHAPASEDGAPSQLLLSDLALASVLASMSLDERKQLARSLVRTASNEDMEGLTRKEREEGTAQAVDYMLGTIVDAMEADLSPDDAALALMAIRRGITNVLGEPTGGQASAES